MAKMNFKQIAEDALFNLGGNTNIDSFTNCQTRLRVTVFSLEKVNVEAIKKITGVYGINITGKQVQIIFGTGKVEKVAKAFEKVATLNKANLTDQKAEKTLEQITADVKKDRKQKNKSKVQIFLSKFSGIFSPLIIGFIGAGILAGISGILGSISSIDNSVAGKSWINFLAVLLNIWKATFLVIVGWRTAEAFGGSGVLGAIIAGIYVTAFSGVIDGVFVPENKGFSVLGIHITNPTHNWLTVGLRPAFKAGAWKLSYPSGSVFGVMFSAGLVGIIQKGFRLFVHDNLDMVVTPTLTLTVLLFLNFFLIIPISGYVFTGVAFLFAHLYNNPIGAWLLAGLFLITIIFGIHQGFVPIYAVLIKNTGINSLFPILAMAGAGQVGMGIALWLKAKKKGKLRGRIQGAIVPAFLGIGEPMLYGVSLPRVKPFVTACIGGSFGGLFIGAINYWIEPIGLNTMFGPSGILAAPLMTTHGHNIGYAVGMYLCGLGISYIFGFLVTYFFGTKNIDLE